MNPSTKILFLAGLASLAPVASAAFFSVDIISSSGGDAYTTGAGVFGDASTRWNGLSRSASASNVALQDETGATSSVTVSWTRTGSGLAYPTGAFANLGSSAMATGDVVIDGLTPGLSYDLAVYSSWNGTPSFTVGAVTKNISASTDWSALTEGTHYALFQSVASGGGTVTFTSNANPTGTGGKSRWSAFQIQPSAVPEPAEYAAVTGLALGIFALVQRRRQAAGR